MSLLKLFGNIWYFLKGNVKTDTDSPKMSYFLLLCSLCAAFSQISTQVYLLGPFALKRYDQTEILPDEDRREILRDIKTIYAPEYRPYVNESLHAHIVQEKRDVRSYDLLDHTRRYYIKTNEGQPTETFSSQRHRVRYRQGDGWEEPKTIILSNDERKDTAPRGTLDVNIPFINDTFIEDLDIKELLYTENFASLLSNSTNETDKDLLKVVTEIYGTTEEIKEDKNENLLQEPVSWTNIEDNREIRAVQGT